VARQDGDPTSTLALARRLAWLRRGDAVLQGGDQRTVDVGDDLLAWLRGERWLAVVNFAATPRRLRRLAGLPERGRLELSTDAHRGADGGEVALDGLQLAAGEAVLVRL
jgi:alpha-glucosidase